MKYIIVLPLVTQVHNISEESPYFEKVISKLVESKESLFRIK